MTFFYNLAKAFGKAHDVEVEYRYVCVCCQVALKMSMETARAPGFSRFTNFVQPASELCNNYGHLLTTSSTVFTFS